nr:hypothetical protein [Tanacetum cinerariifolium]
MAKKDMDTYHSRLTQVDLDELIVKYNIPCDLHPRLLSKGFIMFELMVGSFGAQQGCYLRGAFQSLQIEPAVTLFRKSGFFLIDRRAISDYMSRRHPSSTIEDPKSLVGSYSQEDVRRLSAHIVKLRDIPEEVLVLAGLSQGRDSVLRGSDGNGPLCRGSLSTILPMLLLMLLSRTPTPKDLVVGTPSAKVLAKAKAFKKQKGTRAEVPSLLLMLKVLASGCKLFPLLGKLSTVSVFLGFGLTSAGYDDYGLGKHWKNDKDYCYNLAWIQDSRGKAIMTNVAGASFGNSSHPRPSFGHAHSFQDLFGDAIHRDFFPISHGPCYALYPKGGVAGSCEFSREEWDAPHQPPLVLKLSLIDQFTIKISVLHFPMMSHGGELLTRYRLDYEVSSLKRQVTDHNDKLSSSNVAFVKSKAKEDRKKNIKSLSKNLDQLTAKVARLYVTLNQATVLEAEMDVEIFCDEFTKVGELLSLDASAGFERGLSMHQNQEEFDLVLNKISHFVPSPQGSTLTPISLSLELPSNDAPFLYVAALGQNEEWGIAHPVDENVVQTKSFLARVLELPSSNTMMLWLLSPLERKIMVPSSLSATKEADAAPSGV